ncbi:MAG: molybdenum cofactor biosynthesis protein MoaE [Spirochaetaceae bacterium]|nr:molybdenum cofactor biosynthesis protein MoaE [Spirochaetaceae bacterium]
MSDTVQAAGFALTADAIDPERLRAGLEHPSAGALATFEGRVRNHADGRSVRLLEYQVYPDLAQAEGERVVAEALDRFDIIAAHCTHRSGILPIGDMAVWVGVAAAHRGAAFDACRYIIDEIKRRLPIWKRETYAEGDSGWVNCQVDGAQQATSGGNDGAQ